MVVLPATTFIVRMDRGDASTALTGCRRDHSPDNGNPLLDEARRSCRDEDAHARNLCKRIPASPQPRRVGLLPRC